MRNIFLSLFLVGLFANAQAPVITGSLEQWSKITLTYTSADSYSETGTPNLFLDRKLITTFTSPSGVVFNVPGYFAADGNAAETSATSGTKWIVHFAPSQTGVWTLGRKNYGTPGYYAVSLADITEKYNNRNIE
jgi:hypothetical protein